jgi:hypothetical protein
MGIFSFLFKQKVNVEASCFFAEIKVHGWLCWKTYEVIFYSQLLQNSKLVGQRSIISSEKHSSIDYDAANNLLTEYAKKALHEGNRVSIIPLEPERKKEQHIMKEEKSGRSREGLFTNLFKSGAPLVEREIEHHIENNDSNDNDSDGGDSFDCGFD